MIGANYDESEVSFTNILGRATLEDSGYTGRISSLVAKNIKAMIDTQRISQSDAGKVYSAGLSSAMDQALAFELADKLTEAQIQTEDESIAFSLFEVADAQRNFQLKKALALHKSALADSQFMIEKEVSEHKRLHDFAMFALKKRLADAQIDYETQQILMIAEKIELAETELLIKQQELLIKILELGIAEQELLLMIQKLCLKKLEVALETSKLGLITIQIEGKEEEAYNYAIERETTVPKERIKLITQTALYRRQQEGFGENMANKARAKALEVWGIGYSSAPTSDTVPSGIAGAVATSASAMNALLLSGGGYVAEDATLLPTAAPELPTGSCVTDVECT